MAKKAFLDKIEGGLKLDSGGLSPKMPGFMFRVFGLLKFAFGLCLLPFVYSFSLAFLGEFGLIEKSCQGYFWSGVITFLIIYLFIWEAEVIYARGQRLLEAVFSFFKPLVRVAPYLLPIYAIILFIAYGLLSLGAKGEWLARYTVFLLGFTVALHLVFSARSVRAKKNDFLKSNYIFGFSLVYILNLALMALFLNLIFREFSFVNFFNSSFSAAKDIFSVVFNQLFSAS